MGRPKPFHIPTLDGIRALSITIVFVAHAGLGHIIPGGFGVTVFFFLSGFLISTLLRKEFARSGTISFKHFYLRRVLRIFPPFYSALLFATVLLVAGALPGKLDGKGVGLLAVHFGNYGQIFWSHIEVPRGTGVYWSLAVEEHFYLTFPLIAFLLLRLGRRGITAIVLGGLALAVMAWRVHLCHVGVPADRTYMASDTRIDSILWGCLLALVYNPVLDRPAELPGWARKSMLVFSAAVLVFCFVFREPEFRETYRYTLQGVALLPLFYWGVRGADAPLVRWLDAAPVRYIGTLSYTLYLVHHVVLHSTSHLVPGVPPLAQALIAAALSLSIAALSYRYLERPISRLRQKLS